VDADFEEFSNIDSKFHRYPRVLALGIMLVGIGIGSPLTRHEEELDGQTSRRTSLYPALSQELSHIKIELETSFF
jgi:hypothetical protein